MRITLNIEVSSPEELGEISKALSGIDSEDVEVEETEAEVEKETPKKTSKKVSKKATTKKAKVEEVKEAEEMEEVESPFTEAPNLVDVKNPQAIPEVIQAETVVAEPIPAAPVAQVFDSVAKINELSQKLSSMGLSQEVMTSVVMKARNAVNATQGVAGRDLPEPMRTNLAIALEKEINALQVSI